MFAYKEPVNGLTFNWAGMWDIRCDHDCRDRRAVYAVFRESDKEITAIEVVDGDAALTQGEVK